MLRVLHALSDVAVYAWQLGRADAETVDYLHAAFDQAVSELRLALVALGWTLARKVRASKDPKP